MMIIDLLQVAQFAIQCTGKGGRAPALKARSRLVLRYDPRPYARTHAYVFARTFNNPSFSS